MPTPITIAVLEDEKNFRETIVDLLNTSDDFRCINSFKKVSEFYRHFSTTLPDVFWIDLHLPDGSGIDVITHIKKEWPDALCMVCSFFDNDDAVFSALREGADAYLLKIKRALWGRFSYESHNRQTRACFFQNLTFRRMQPTAYFQRTRNS